MKGNPDLSVMDVYQRHGATWAIDVADVLDRMPVIVKGSDWADRLDGAPDEAGLLFRPYPDLIACDRTSDTWTR
jgi:putative SOS response-associated peptidase YedK